MEAQELGNTCVVGLQWGDEGKGKIVDRLVGDFDVVVRFSGGANAGHTIVVGDEKFALHQLPSSALHESALGVIGCGCVLDPAVVLGEIESLRQRGISLDGRLLISDRCHLVMPYHRREDQLAEKTAPDGAKIGTTARGIGPCYTDRAARRNGIRLCDLAHPEALRDRLKRILSQKHAQFAALYNDHHSFKADLIAAECAEFGTQLRPYVGDTTSELHERLQRGQRILFEGAQGSLLDLDHGTFPFVTSTTAGVGGAAAGAGVPPQVIQSVVGVLKAYTTRVGEGPFPTELKNDTGDRIRRRGNEFGTTTGRPRRCGWLDLVALRYVTRFTGPTHLALMHLDTLTSFEQLKLCVGYRLKGDLISTFPAAAAALAEVEPVYETLPGWEEELRECRSWEDLPLNARNYVETVGERLGTPVRIISIGPGREQTIIRDDEA